MQINGIRTEADYLACLHEISALIDLDPAFDDPELVTLMQWRVIAPKAGSTSYMRGERMLFQYEFITYFHSYESLPWES